MLEVEVKIKLDDFDGVITKLVELGYQKGTTVYEYDNYYNSKYYDLKEADKALRIRKHLNVETGAVKYVLNYKGPKCDDYTMTREEYQFEVPSLELGESIINGLGYHVAGNVEKTRIHYVKDGIKICLDEVTNLGKYMELEVMAGDESGYDEAISIINDILLSLGYSMSDSIRKSYLSMIW